MIPKLAARASLKRGVRGVQMRSSASAGPPPSSALHSSSLPHGMKSLSPDCTVERVLEGLCGFQEAALQQQSQFVKPSSLTFTQAGKARRWDLVAAHESVAAVLHDSAADAFIIVRQFRPAVYAARRRAAAAAGLPEPEPSAGLSYELCAGILDKPDKTVEQVMCDEILEEVGYRLAPASLTRIATVVSSAGITGSPQTMFFAQVDDSNRVCAGGGTMAAEERVEALSLPAAAADAFIADEAITKTPGLCFGLLWSRQRKLGEQ